MHNSDNIFWNVKACVNVYVNARCQKWLLLKRSSRLWSFRHAIAWVWGGTLRWLSKCNHYVIVIIRCLLSLEFGYNIHLVWWLSDSVISCVMLSVRGQVKFESFLSPAVYNPIFYVLIPLGLGLPLGPHGLWTCLSWVTLSECLGGQVGLLLASCSVCSLVLSL